MSRCIDGKSHSWVKETENIVVCSGCGFRVNARGLVVQQAERIAELESQLAELHELGRVIVDRVSEHQYGEYPIVKPLPWIAGPVNDLEQLLPSPPEGAE